jgi:hypothetical protein
MMPINHHFRPFMPFLNSATSLVSAAMAITFFLTCSAKGFQPVKPSCLYVTPAALLASRCSRFAKKCAANRAFSAPLESSRRSNCFARSPSVLRSGFSSSSALSPLGICPFASSREAAATEFNFAFVSGGFFLAIAS